MPNFLELEDDTLLVLEGNHEFYLLLEDNTTVADQVEISLPKTSFLEESVFSSFIVFISWSYLRFVMCNWRYHTFSS